MKNVRNSTGERTIFISLTCFAALAVTILSILPNGHKLVVHSTGRFHVWEHLVAFGTVAYFAARISRCLFACIILFVSSLVLGLGIEFAQYLIFHSPMEWKDVLLDVAGITGGTLIAILNAPNETKPRTVEAAN